MNVAYVVQHHPSRADLLPRLLPSLHMPVVVTDPDPQGLPNPWRCYQACLQAVPEDATHLAILQDDALPVEGFTRRVDELVAEKPTEILVLFVSAAPAVKVAVLRAQRGGQRWAILNPQGFTPVVATVYPREHVEGLRAWADGLPESQHRRSDDHMVSVYCRKHRVFPVACVPSVCDHDEETPSLIGARAASHRRVVSLLA